jgi:hypothetical protein
MKRKFIVLSVALLVFALGAVGASAKANFSGTWTLDKSKTEGLPPTFKDQVLTVAQTGDKLTIESKITWEQGEQADNSTYTVDGKPADFTDKRPNGIEGKGKRTAKWSADGNSIEITEAVTYDTPNGSVAVDATRKWTLSADGKTLTIEMDLTSPMGNQHSKRVLVKKA